MVVERIRSYLIAKRVPLAMRKVTQSVQPGDLTRLRRLDAVLDGIERVEMAVSPHWWRLEASVAAARAAAALMRVSMRLRRHPPEPGDDDDE